MPYSLKKGMQRVLIANIISLVFNMLTNFILPKYLSMESYSAIKTFQLYLSYVGIIHFGYIDGVYLKYGGKHFNQIDKKDIKTNLFTFRIFQTIVTILMVIIAFITKDNIILAFALAILPVNIVTYFKFLAQAIGEFKKYGKIINLTSIFTFLINFILVFLVHTDNYTVFLLSYVMWNFIICIILEIYVNKKLFYISEKVVFSFDELINNIKSGYPLTLGNFSSVLLTSIDRWFVKFLMGTICFAQYSFAVSIESFVNIALTPITVTLYNYFCKYTDINEIKKIRNCVMIFASFIVSCAFGAKFIIEHFLEKYMDASNVMFILFASHIIYMIIKGVYVNIYKAEKKQKKYLAKLVLVVISGIFLNAFIYYFIRIKEAFAVATLLSALIWLVLCLQDFPLLKFKYNEVFFLILTTCVFIVSGVMLNSILGFVVYILSVILFAGVLMRKDFIYLLKVLNSCRPQLSNFRMEK